MVKALIRLRARQPEVPRAVGRVLWDHEVPRAVGGWGRKRGGGVNTFFFGRNGQEKTIS